MSTIGPWPPPWNRKISLFQNTYSNYPSSPRKLLLPFWPSGDTPRVTRRATHKHLQINKCCLIYVPTMSYHIPNMNSFMCHIDSDIQPTSIWHTNEPNTYLCICKNIYINIHFISLVQNTVICRTVWVFSDTLPRPSGPASPLALLLLLKCRLTHEMLLTWRDMTDRHTQHTVTDAIYIWPFDPALSYLPWNEQKRPSQILLPAIFMLLSCSKNTSIQWSATVVSLAHLAHLGALTSAQKTLLNLHPFILRRNIYILSISTIHIQCATNNPVYPEIFANIS